MDFQPDPTPKPAQPGDPAPLGPDAEPARPAPRGERAPAKVALVLQGGGALGAYQAGVYQALHEAGLDPDWIAGVSIGSINAAIIAGNPRDRRLERLEQFWTRVTSRPVGATPHGDWARKLYNTWSATLTTGLGQPGFFTPNVPGPWLTPRGAHGATSFYDNAPLRDTLAELVDFELINDGRVRFACGSVNVATGNFSYFDNARTTIEATHVMASGALPPALPMTRIGTDWYWDGGLVSNTPLQHLLDHAGANDMLVFQVDLFSARGPVPRDMMEVMARQKDIQYSSRTRLVTEYYMRLHQRKVQLKTLLERLPDAGLSEEERRLKRELATLPNFSILHLIYQEAAYEGQMKDFEFSAASMREHWEAGLRDTRRTLAHEDWLRVPGDDRGIVVHDVHRVAE